MFRCPFERSLRDLPTLDQRTQRSQHRRSIAVSLAFWLLLLLRLRLLRRLLLRLRNGSAERRVAWVLGRVRCWVCGAGSSSWVVRVV